MLQKDKQNRELGLIKALIIIAIGFLCVLVAIAEIILI